jgi:hypothetical protein
MEELVLEYVKWLCALGVLIHFPIYLTGILRSIIHDRSWRASMTDVYISLSIIYLYVNGLP